MQRQNFFHHDQKSGKYKSTTVVVLTGESVEKLKPKQHNHKISIFVEKVENQMGKTRITPMAWKEKKTWKIVSSELEYFN